MAKRVKVAWLFQAMSNDANALKRKEQIKKILVYGGMVMLCLVSFYFIFKPSKEQVQAEQQKVGFNAELPDPRGAGIEADKIAAYELEDMRVKQEQKMRTLEDFTAMTTDDEEEEVVEIPEAVARPIEVVVAVAVTRSHLPHLPTMTLTPHSAVSTKSRVKIPKRRL